MTRPNRSSSNPEVPVLRLLAAAIMLVGTAGCRQHNELYAHISDGAGLRCGDAVIVFGTNAGTVEDVRVDPKGGVLITFVIGDECRRQLHVGAKASAVRDIRSGFASELWILYGRESRAPLLQDGAVLPEASLAENLACTLVPLTPIAGQLRDYRAVDVLARAAAAVENLLRRESRRNGATHQRQDD